MSDLSELVDAIHAEWPGLRREVVTEMALNISDCARFVLPILVRLASSETKRELLRQLQVWQVDDLVESVEATNDD